VVSRGAEERDGNEKLGRRSWPCAEHDKRMSMELSMDRVLAILKIKYRDPKQYGDRNRMA
jgi:hypothetical protein